MFIEVVYIHFIVPMKIYLIIFIGGAKMSRVSNALKMYMLLQGRQLIKAEELAYILEVSTRMIQEYKNDLEKAGIYIGSKRGRNGGYYLENTFDLKGIEFGENEIEALKMATEVIKSGNYPYSVDFQLFSSKILNAAKDYDFTSYYSKPAFKHKSMNDKEKRIWQDINKAIMNKKKVKMNYTSMREDKRSTKVRIVHPYGVFDYEGSTYFYGYCELRKEVRFFKIPRIHDYEILDENFCINIKYDIREVVSKSFGIYNDELIDIIIKIHYPMSEIVKEKQYAVEQFIEEIDEDTIMFKARMKGYKEIKSWVLSMGSLAEVIAPKKLKDDILAEVKTMIELYE